MGLFTSKEEKEAQRAATDSQRAYTSILQERPPTLNASAYEYGFAGPELRRQLDDMERRQQGLERTYAGYRQDLYGRQDPYSQAQLGLMRMLQEGAAGRGPSIATQQFNASTQTALQQALALQASTRGTNPAMALREALQAQAGVQADASQQAAILRTQEQLAAREQLAALIQQGRGAELGLAQTALDYQRQLDVMTQYYLSTSASLQEAQMKARMTLEQDRLRGYAAHRGVSPAPYPQFGPTDAETAMGFGVGVAGAAMRTGG